MLSVFQKKIVSYAITALAFLVLAAFVVLAFRFFGMFLNAFYYVLFPVAVAVILSYAAEPAVRLLAERTKLSKKAACGLCFAAIALVATAALVFGVPYVLSQVSEMSEALPELFDKIVEYMSENAPRVKDFLAEQFGAISVSAEVKPTTSKEAVAEIVKTAKFASVEIAAVASFFAALAVVPIYLYYILVSEWDFFDWLNERISFLPPNPRANVVFFVRRFSEIMQSFFRGQLLIAFIMGSMLGTGLLVAGVRFGFILGMTAGLLNIIPYFGTMIGLGVILPVAFFEAGGGMGLCLTAAAIFGVVQLVEGYYLTPKIMGHKTGLHPTVIIFSVFFWGTALNGILGMILAIPFSAFIVAAYPKFHEWLSDFVNSRVQD